MNCSICFDDIEVSASLCPCSSICENCFDSYIESEITQAKIHPNGNLSCYYCLSRCSGEITAECVMNKISDDSWLLQKYEQFRMNAQIAADPKRFWCPFPNCNGIATIIDPFQNKAKCETCEITFCSSCKQQHSSLFPFCRGTSSASDPSVSQWKSSNGGKCKKCPNCRHLIEKNGGCNHMTCSLCRHEFCWRCKSPYQEGCQAGKMCRFLALNRHHCWGQTTLSRTASKSVLYPVLTGIFCVGVGTGVGLAVGAGVSAVAVGSVTILPYIGMKKLYSATKDHFRHPPELEVSIAPTRRRKDLGIMKHREAGLERSHTYPTLDFPSFIDEIRIQSPNKTYLDSISENHNFEDDRPEDLDEVSPVESSLSIAASSPL